MNTFKKIIRQVITFLLHPVISWYLFLHGSRSFYILPQMTIKNKQYLKAGSNFYLGRNSRLMMFSGYKGGRYSPGIIIGSNITIGNRFTALSAAPITIGDDCLLASDILIASENHGTDPEKYTSYADNPLDAAPVTIGKGCWIGEKAIILPGVNLGDKCIVAAGAVVNKSFPAYTIVAGMPAKAIKQYDFNRHQWVRVRE